MKSNDEVISCFINGVEAANRTLWTGTNANKLFSYDTCICQKFDKKIIYNATHYSNTTSRQQYSLRQALKKFKNVVEVNDVPRDSIDLTNYI